MGPKMDAVEEALVLHLGDCTPRLRLAAEGVLKSGGKRLRPILHLLSADLLGYAGDGDVLCATVLEYIHVASLLHDDVIDEAALRRGEPSLNQQLGNTLSVLVGDYLCVKALSLAALSGHADVTQLISRTTLDLVEGEAIQELFTGRLDVTQDECLHVIELKTARLMAAACETGAALAGEGASSPRRRALREYGLRLGVAFQLVDDILDFESDEATLGKPVLNDLGEGKLTLPAVRALEVGGAEARRIIGAVIEDRGFERVKRSDVVRLLRETGGLDVAAHLAREAATAAKAALAPFPAGPSRDALVLATDYALTRKF